MGAKKWIKIILLPVFLFGLVIGFSNMAYAERVYLYKDIADINSDYNRLYGHQMKTNISPAVSLNFSLPKKGKGEQDFRLSFFVGIPPSSKVSTEFKLEIDRIRIRDEKGNYAIHPLEPTQYQQGDKVAVTDKGEIFGRAPFGFNINKSFSASFGIKINQPLPETLYLDYKMRITSDAGEEEVLEGTVTMEKTHYNEKAENPFLR